MLQLQETAGMTKNNERNKKRRDKIKLGFQTVLLVLRDFRERERERESEREKERECVNSLFGHVLVCEGGGFFLFFLFSSFVNFFIKKNKLGILLYFSTVGDVDNEYRSSISMTITSDSVYVTRND